MTPQEALRILMRERPCAHESADTTLGNGEVWARCCDCDQTFQQAHWERARAAAAEFDTANDVLATALAEMERLTRHLSLEVAASRQMQTENARFRAAALHAKNLLLAWNTDGCADSNAHAHLHEETFELAVELVQLVYGKTGA